MPRTTALSRAISCISLMMLPIGCVKPSEKIESSLLAFGVDDNQAKCVGSQLQRNLTIGQLRELGRAARAYSQGDAKPQRLTVSDLVRVSSQIEDVRVPIEVGKAAANCGLLSGALL